MITRVQKAVAVVVLSLLAASACSAPGRQGGATPTSSATQPPSPADPTGDAPNLEGPTRLAVEDLAQRLGVATGDITILSVEPVSWADTSLGCPAPGVVYAQVEVPGYRIELLARGEAHTYHTDRRDTVVLCEWRWPMSAPATPKPGEIDDGQPWMPVY